MQTDPDSMSVQAWKHGRGGKKNNSSHALALSVTSNICKVTGVISYPFSSYDNEFVDGEVGEVSALNLSNALQWLYSSVCEFYNIA